MRVPHGNRKPGRRYPLTGSTHRDRAGGPGRHHGPCRTGLGAQRSSCGTRVPVVVIIDIGLDDQVSVTYERRMNGSGYRLPSEVHQ